MLLIITPAGAGLLLQQIPAELHVESHCAIAWLKQKVIKNDLKKNFIVNCRLGINKTNLINFGLIKSKEPEITQLYASRSGSFD